MALRCLLVGLVACLGFELPTSQDVDSWTVAGRDWVANRVIDLSAMQVQAAGWFGAADSTANQPTEKSSSAAPSALVAAGSSATTLPADLAFDSINEGMALAFADDLEATRTREALAQAVVAQPEPVVAAIEPLVQPEGDTLPLAFPAADTESTLDEGDEPMDDAVAREDRLASAVRLTREAVEAWAAVIQATDVESTATH